MCVPFSVGCICIEVPHKAHFVGTATTPAPRRLISPFKGLPYVQSDALFTQPACACGDLFFGEVLISGVLTTLRRRCNLRRTGENGGPTCCFAIKFYASAPPAPLSAADRP